MVGDGATDLEARQPDAAGIFIGCAAVIALSWLGVWLGGLLGARSGLVPVLVARCLCIAWRPLLLSPVRGNFSAPNRSPTIHPSTRILNPKPAPITNPPTRYGGVVARPNIAVQADWYIYKIQALIDALP